MTLQDLIYTSRNSLFILCAIKYNQMIDSLTVLHDVFCASRGCFILYS